MELVKALAKAIGLTIAIWFACFIILTWVAGAVWGFFLAGVLAFVAFFVSLYIFHPGLGEFVTDLLWWEEGDTDSDRSKRSRRAKEVDEASAGRDLLRRVRRGDPHKGI